MTNCHHGHIVRGLAVSRAVPGTGSINFGILFSAGEDHKAGGS